MPYQVEDIRLFTKGIATNIDPTDLASNACVWSFNVDAQSELGVLKGIDDNTYIQNENMPKFKDGAIIQKTIDNTLKYSLIYTDGTNIKANDTILQNEASTANGLSSHSLDKPATVFNVQNDACYIGTGNNPPIWAGYYKDGLQLNGAIVRGEGDNGLNDIALELIEVSLSATKIFKIKVTNTSTFKLLDVYVVSGETVYDTFTYNSNEQEFVLNDNVHITGERTMYPENPNDPVWNSSIDLITTVTHLETINGIKTVKFNNFSSLQLESGYISLEQTTRVRIIKSPNDKSYYDIINWNSDSIVNPTYSLTNRVFIPKNDYFILSDNFRIKFLNEVGHTMGNMWTITINPISDNFLMEVDKSIISQEYLVGKLFSVSDSTFGNEVTDGFFKAGKQLNYGISFIYDFLTESPIYTDITMRFFPLVNCSKHTITWYFNKNELPKRITGFNIYFGIANAGNKMPDGFFRLIKSVTITPNEEVITAPTGVLYIQVVNQNNISSSYESNSGISQDTESFEIKYTYATKLNNQLFVTKCFHAEIPNAERMLFKSKTFRLHKFDWVNEYLVFDFVPLGIASIFGKIFVFGENKTVKINAEQFYIEDELEGIGIISNKHFVATDFGLFFADKNNVYKFDGSRFDRISLVIKNKVNLNDNFTTNAKSWKDFAVSCDMVLCDNKRRAILFGSKVNNNGFIYDIDNERWDFLGYLSSSYQPNIEGGLTFVDGGIRLFETISSEGI